VLHYPYRVPDRVPDRAPNGMPVTTRREFLRTAARFTLGTTATGALLATGSSTLTGCSGASNGSLPDDVQIVQRFPQNLVVGLQRMPISLAAGGGLLTVDGEVATPSTLRADVVRIDGGRDETILTGIVAEKHAAELAVPYWLFRTEITEPGFYRLVLDGGPSDGAAFQVATPSAASVPGVGEVMPPFDTPTFADARGVNPICTRQPKACPLHEVTLREALAARRPVAYLIGTPAHCSTGTCTPALEALITLSERYADQMTFIHAEVYADADATTLAPAVEAARMNYEPALFVADAAGIIVARLDAVFDGVELDAVLSELVS